MNAKERAALYLVLPYLHTDMPILETANETDTVYKKYRLTIVVTPLFCLRDDRSSLLLGSIATALVRFATAGLAAGSEALPLRLGRPLVLLNIRLVKS